MRSRKIVPGCLGLLLAIGLGLWLARDVPRRIVAAVLSERLNARVDLDQVTVAGAHGLVLAGLKVSQLRDYPAIDSLRLEELVVDGSLGDLLDNRFERVRLRGALLRLAPAPAAKPVDRPLPLIGELVLEPATLRIATGGGGEDLELCLEGTVRDVGTRAQGELRLRAAELDLQPLYALTGAASSQQLDLHLANLDAELALDPGGARIAAHAAGASLAAAGGRLELEQPVLAADRFGGATTIRLTAASAVAQQRGWTLEAGEPGADATLTAAADGTLTLELVPRFAGLAGGRLQAVWDPARATFSSFEARLRGLDLERLMPESGVAATADLEARADGDRLDYRLDLRATDLVAGELELRGATARVAGSLAWAPELQTPVWDGPVTAAVEVQGGGRWGSFALPPAALPLAAGFDGRWTGGANHSFTGAFRLECLACGRLRADGELVAAPGGSTADLTWAWTGIELESLVGLLRSADPALPAFELTGRGQAAGSWRGPLGAEASNGARFSGRLDLGQLVAGGDTEVTEAGAWHLAAGEAQASWSWDFAQAMIEVPQIKGSGTLTLPELEPLDLVLDGAAALDPQLARGRLEGTLEESPGRGSGLGSARVKADWRRTEGRTLATAQVGLAALDLGRWHQAAKPLAAAGALADYRLAGVVDAELAGSLEGAEWSLAGPLHLGAAGFTSSDGSRVVEGLEGAWDVSVHGAPAAPLEVEASGRLGGCQLLWDTFFGDFSSFQPAFTMRAAIEPTGGQARRWRLEIGATLAGGPTAEAAFDGAGDTWRYALSVDDRDLAATHARYLAPLLADTLGRIELGGALAARARGSGGSASWSLIGDLQLKGLRLTSGGAQAEIAGLDLDLPLDLRRSPGPGEGRPDAALELSGPRLSGRIAFERLAVRGLELPPMASDLAVEADSVGLERPITLSLLGGAMTLERLTLSRLLRPTRALESSIELAGIRLEKISEQLELFPLEGELGGRLTGVRLSPSLLAVDGGGEIEVFGGRVLVRDISGQDVLSRFPKLKFSADLHDLDLGALTRRIDFGEMTGILEGSLEDCELFRGVPVRFAARLETVERPGVPRTVDVKAVNNLTILGTGQRTNVFDRGIQRFFDRYTYERLAITLRLDHDVLLLRGLEHRGERELFLRGRLPLRIDVVNAQPGKTVSFQTMVRRLKSLDFASATSQP